MVKPMKSQLQRLALAAAASLAPLVAQAGIYPECPPGAVPLGPNAAGNGLEESAAPRVCGHLTAGDGWIQLPSGERSYIFGFSLAVGEASAQTHREAGAIRVVTDAPARLEHDGIHCADGARVVRKLIEILDYHLLARVRDVEATEALPFRVVGDVVVQPVIIMSAHAAASLSLRVTFSTICCSRCDVTICTSTG